MESTSDTESSPKRRRFSTDNPFCDPDDTDLSSYDIRNVNNSARLPSLQTNSTNNSHDTSTDASQSVNDITFNGVFDDFSVPTNQQDELVNDFKKAMAQFSGGGGDSATVGAEEIKRTLQDLQPFDNIIYLYVRFARQQPTSNFNADSLCSLLCIAKQCKYKSYIFLTKVRSFQVRNIASSKYGVKFSFVTRNTKEVDGMELTKKFLGLKYTLEHLQATVTTKSEAINKANSVESTFSPFLTAPTKSCASLYSKLWVGIEHRWLAYHIVDHLFSRNKALSWTSQQIFVFSIQVFVPCGKCRYNFLKPLVGLCLRFNNHAQIDLCKDQLTSIQDDPLLFHSFGNACLRDKSHELQIQSIGDTFSNLNRIIQRRTSYDGIPLESKWLLLQAYSYYLWLELSQNHGMKGEVILMLAKDKESTDSSSMEHSSTTATSVDCHASSGKKGAPPKSTPQQAGHDNGGLHLLLNSRPKFTSKKIRNNVPPEIFTTTLPPDSYPIACSDSAWSHFRLLSNHELNEYFASFLVIRRDDGVDIVSRLSAVEIYSADNLHKFPHARFNGDEVFFPKSKIGEVVLSIGNQIDEFIDVTSKSFHIARESSVFFRDHGKLVPPIEDIATLCRAVIIHGRRDSKRCSGQHRAFIGNGGLDFPNGIPTTIVDGGFRKSLTDDPSLCHDGILAPNQHRHSSYANHLCKVLSMANCVSFEHITLVVSPIHPNTPDLSEHMDVMNDSMDGYTRTGTLSMCFVNDNGENLHSKHGVLVQVIGSFRRVIGQFMGKTGGTSSPPPPVAQDLLEGNVMDKGVNYQPADRELFDIAYKLGECFRSSNGSTKKITFQGRKSRTSDGSQIYNNNYTKSHASSSNPYRFKVAIFGDTDYARQHNIQQMKVLGHMDPPHDISTQVNSLQDHENGTELLEYLARRYGMGNKLDSMRAASYHQQIINEDERRTLEWTVFEGHIDKNFVHTAWFIPLTGATFYTFIAVPSCWNVPTDANSESQYRDWVAGLGADDREKLVSYKEAFKQEGKEFMNESDVDVLIYICSVGCFLSFPANLCYHATLSIGASRQDKAMQEMKDLLIVYPMERG